jgi:hypothetical protein
MTGTAIYTRPQWPTDKHIAHPCMMLADGSQVDAVRNLDKGSPYPHELAKKEDLLSPACAHYSVWS